MKLSGVFTQTHKHSQFCQILLLSQEISRKRVGLYKAYEIVERERYTEHSILYVCVLSFSFSTFSRVHQPLDKVNSINSIYVLLLHSTP